MQIVSNYKKIVTQSDRTKSLNNKQDLRYLLKKFFVNNDGTPFNYKGLTKKQLYVIWMRNRPRDLFDQFHIIGE